MHENNIKFYIQEFCVWEEVGIPEKILKSAISNCIEYTSILVKIKLTNFRRGHCDRDCMISWIYNYLYNQCISLLTLWVRISLRQGVLDIGTPLCDKVCQWLETGRWFSPGTPISSTNKTDRHDIAENVVESGAKHHNPNTNPS